MINTGDYYRTILPFIDDITPFQTDVPTVFPLKQKFASIFDYQYKSSYNYFLYLYAKLISFFTDTLNINYYAYFLVSLYIIILYNLQKSLKNTSNIIFIFASIFLISSSNIGFFKSFYQEQIILILLPLTLIFLKRNNNIDIFISFLLVTALSTPKSQFFYLPILATTYYFIFNRDKLILKLPLMCLSLIISYSCIIYTQGTVEYNKYHAAYFGSYNYLKLNHLPINQHIDTKCIGIDAWGNKFDLVQGAIFTNIGESCFNRYKDTISFTESLKIYLQYPLMIFKIPYDKGVQGQLTENYFHVYKSIPILINNTGILAEISNVKDILFKNIRFSVLAIFFIFSIFLRKRENSGIVFFTSAFGLSQFYISFMAEGYRDLAKHIFPMNFSFDLILFISIIVLGQKIMKKNP